MNLKTTLRIERAKMHVLRVIESEWRAARKADEHSVLLLTRQLCDLRDAASKEWSQWYDRVKELRIAEAKRKDKGEVWFTVFRPEYPGADGLKEITVTPRLEIVRYVRLPWFAKPEPPKVDLRQSDETLEKALQRSHEWGQKYYCKPEKAAEARRKDLPAWGAAAQCAA